MTPWPRSLVSVLAASLALLAACKGDDGGSQGSSDDANTGFGDDDSGSQGSESVDESVGESQGETDPTGVETLGEGELRGILTFTRYLADPVIDTDEVAMAGAWRHVDVGWDGVEDFVAVFPYQSGFPLPPAGDDELEHNDVPAPFDWGDVEDWRPAGNAMKLRSGDVEALACLLEVGMVGDIFPVYAATTAMVQPEGCAPELDDWVPDTDYDIVLYGGDAFADNVLLDQVHTPATFTATAPDLDELLLAVPRSQALTVQWDGAADEGSRFVIRVWDDFGRMFTIRAVDDGEYSIPAADLGVLAEGPITISLARERVADVPFTDGIVKAVTRVERRGYLDLYAE